jgi:hypothetical protein
MGRLATASDLPRTIALKERPVALNEQFTNLSDRIVADFNTGQSTRMSLGVSGTAFGWTGGMPNTVADFCPTVQIVGMSVPVGTVTPSGTPVTIVGEKAPKPAATTVAIASTPIKKFAGQGRCSIEGVLEAAGLTAAITSVLGAGALLAFEEYAIGLLDAATTETAAGADWIAAILAGQAQVIGNGGNPGLLIVGPTDYAAVVTAMSSQAGYSIDPASPVGSFWGSRIHVSAKAPAGKVYVADPLALLAIENESSPMVIVDSVSAANTNEIIITADLLAGFTVPAPHLVTECTKTP